MPWGTVSTLTLPCRQRHVGLGIITSAKDAALRELKDVDTWMRTWRSFPLVAHWADGEPLDDDVAIMAKIEDRHRSFVVDGTPVATGVLAVADSWACTNPSLGRGASIGFMHAVALRDLLRVASIDVPMELAQRWHEVTEATVEPYYRATLDFDRHRLAEIDAGHRRARRTTRAIRSTRSARRWQSAAGKDPELFRALLKIVGVLDVPEDGARAARRVREGRRARRGLARRPGARADPRGVAGHRGRLRNGGQHADRFQRRDARRAGRGRGPAGRAAARLPRHEAAVVEAGARARRRRASR